MGRISVFKTWNLSELRRVDRTGLPIARSIQFGLFLSINERIVWRTDNPLKCSKFLWSSLKVCASRLKRAPSVQRLELLDPLTFADHYTPSFSSSAQKHSQKLYRRNKSQRPSRRSTRNYIKINLHMFIKRINYRTPTVHDLTPHATVAVEAVNIVDD